MFKSISKPSLFFLAGLFFAANVFGAVLQTNTTTDEYSIAAGYYERQEYEEAIEKFREFIHRYPSTRQAAISHFFLGESLVQIQDYQSAYPAFQIFLRRLPNDNFATRAQFRMAECAYRLSWKTQATSLLERFIQKHPTNNLNEYALTYLAETRLRRHEPQLALQVFERVMASYPNTTNSSRHRLGMARALQALNRDQEALGFYEMLVSNRNDGVFGQARMQIGVIQFSAGRYDQAQQNLREAVDWMVNDKHLSEARFWLAKTEMALEQFEAAYQHLAEVIEETNNDELKPAALFDGAVAASKSNRPDVAISWVGQLQKTWPDSRWADSALRLKIELQYQHDLYDDAIQDIARFQKEFADHENLPIILEYKGRIHYDRGEHRKTVVTFQDLLDRFGEAAQFEEKTELWLYFQGLGQLGQHEYGPALQTFELIRGLKKTTEFRGSVLLAKASCAAGMKTPERAIGYLEEFMGMDPDGSQAVRARSDLAVAYAQAGHWESAEGQLQNLAESHSDRMTLLETTLLLGEYALKDRRYDFSEQCFRQLSDSANPRKYVVRGLSGVAWVRLSRGDEKSSVEVFERLVSEYAETEFAAEAAMACGRYFEQNEQYEKAVEMYSLVQTRFSETDFARIAELRRAYGLYKSGGESNLIKSEAILLKYKNRESLYLDEAAYQLAWIYQETDRSDKARRQFGQIAEHFKDSKYWADAAYRVAQFALHEHEYDTTRELVEELLAADIGIEIETRTTFLLGQVAVQDEDWATVKSSMLEVLANTDEEVLRKATRYWLAESLYQLAQYETAIEELDRLVSNPDLITEKRLAWVFLRRTQCFAHDEKWSDAMEKARIGKKKFPEFEAYHEFDFIIGRSHAAQGRLTEARESYGRVIDSERGGSTQTAAMAQWRIGETFFHQENYEQAIQAYYRVDSLYSYEKWRAAALVEAGKCQELLGNWNHATRLYKQLIEKFPDSEFRDVAESRLSTANRQAKRIKTETQK